MANLFPRFRYDSFHTGRGDGFGLYNRLSQAGNANIDLGTKSGGVLTAMYIRNGSNQFSVFNNTATSASVANAVTQGMFITNRRLATTMDFYVNKTSLGPVIKGVTAIPNNPFYILAHNHAGLASLFSTKQISMGFFGASLSQSEVNTLTDSFETYMDFNGKGVIV